MADVFVCYASEDNYFVDFLAELLRFHHVDVWVDRGSLHPGATFTSEIETYLASSDRLLAIMSQHSLKSRWMTREISYFKAIHPDRAIIPIALDAKILDDMDNVYDGLGAIESLKFHESMLDGFRGLLHLLDRELFPVVERRKTSDRRSQDRREARDRRRSPIEQRLRVGISNSYTKLTGKGELEPLKMASDVGRLAHLLADANSPLESFSFFDRRTGQEVNMEFDALEHMAFDTWRSLERERLRGAAYIIDGVISQLMTDYIITSKDRRAVERRGESSRRKGSGPSTDGSGTDPQT
jgi:TIR domain